MDNVSQEEFDRLVKLNPEDLSPEQRAFLNARRGYLNHDQENTFANVLKAEQKAVADLATADANDKAEPTGKGAAAKPTKNQSANDTAKQTPEDEDLGTVRETAEQKADSK